VVSAAERGGLLPWSEWSGELRERTDVGATGVAADGAVGLQPDGRCPIEDVEDVAVQEPSA